MPQAQQDDLFSPSSRLPSSQNSFRFGSQASIGQAQQPQPSGGDEFPPLNRNGNGEIGQDRVASLMSGLNLGSQGQAASTQARGSGNGLLNAVTANTRASEARSPVGMVESELQFPSHVSLNSLQVLDHQKDGPRSLRMMRDRNPHSVRMALRPSRPFRMDQINLLKPAILSVLLATTRQAAKVLSHPLKLRPPHLKSLLLACQKQTNMA